MEASRVNQKFLDELWAYANRVEEAVENYKVIARDYRIASYDMSFRATATQFDEVMDFYGAAVAYVEAAEETYKLTKNQTTNTKTSEREGNAAIFKPQTLLHNGSINEFRQWQERFGAYFQQNHIDKNNLLVQRSFLITCIDDELAAVIHSKHPVRDVKIYHGHMDTLKKHFERLLPLHVRLLKMAMHSPTSDNPEVFFLEFIKLMQEADVSTLLVETVCLALMATRWPREDLRPTSSNN